MSIHALAWGWIDTEQKRFLPCECYQRQHCLPAALVQALCGKGLVGQLRGLDLRPVACRRLLLAWNFLMLFAVCEVEAVSQLPSEIRASSLVSCRLPLPAPG